MAVLATVIVFLPGCYLQALFAVSGRPLLRPSLDAVLHAEPFNCVVIRGDIRAHQFGIGSLIITNLFLQEIHSCIFRFEWIFQWATNMNLNKCHGGVSSEKGRLRQTGEI